MKVLVIAACLVATTGPALIAQWQRVNTLTAPHVRFNTVMAYGLGGTLLFGGDTGWPLFGWSTVAPVGGVRPPARDGGVMTYDSWRGVCLLTNGFLAVAPGTPFEDTWEFDGASWRQMPSWVVPGRGAPAIAFDAARRQVVLFGGLQPTVAYYNDTWAYGAKVRSIGSGCVGTHGVPALVATDAPRLGLAYTLNLSQLNPAIGLAGLAIGFRDTGAVPLDAFGWSGCTAYVRPDLLLALPTAGGSASWTTTIPFARSLFAVPLFSQGISVDPNANPAGLVTSNGYEGTIGQ